MERETQAGGGERESESEAERERERARSRGSRPHQALAQAGTVICLLPQLLVQSLRFAVRDTLPACVLRWWTTSPACDSAFSLSLSLQARVGSPCQSETVCPSVCLFEWRTKSVRRLSPTLFHSQSRTHSHTQTHGSDPSIETPAHTNTFLNQSSVLAVTKSTNFHLLIPPLLCFFTSLPA